MQRKIHSQANTGYTIIETMVAISVFLVVIMYGTTALLNANLLHRKSADMRTIMDNLSFIMDEMSRSIRTGYDYRCMNVPADFSENPLTENISTPKSGASCSGIAFENAEGGDQSNISNQWVYFISNNRVGKVVGTPYLGETNYVQLNPSDEGNNVVINHSASKFTIIGAEAGDEQQPMVIIRLVGTISYKGVDTPFSLQTSVSQRVIDS
jgi:hypothetical protein